MAHSPHDGALVEGGVYGAPRELRAVVRAGVVKHCKGRYCGVIRRRYYSVSELHSASHSRLTKLSDHTRATNAMASANIATAASAILSLGIPRRPAPGSPLGCKHHGHAGRVPPKVTGPLHLPGPLCVCSTIAMEPFPPGHALSALCAAISALASHPAPHRPPLASARAM